MQYIGIDLKELYTLLYFRKGHVPDFSLGNKDTFSIEIHECKQVFRTISKIRDSLRH